MGDNVVSFEDGLSRLLPINANVLSELGLSPLGFDDEYTGFMKMWDEEFMELLTKRREDYENLYPSPEWDAMDKIAYDEVVLQLDKKHGTNVSGAFAEQKVGRVLPLQEDNVVWVDFSKKRG